MSRIASVLIVDDQEDLVENIAEILTVSMGQDIRCLTSGSAEEAVAIAKEVHFELALLDLHLLDGSGLELLEQLRTLIPTLQVVFITGDAAVESAIQALERGAFGYLLKPFLAEQLIDVASKAIERAQLLRERETLRAELERSERQHREVIDRVPAFVLALDEEGKILVWNRQLEEVTGYSSAEMVGVPNPSLSLEDGVRRISIKGGGHRSVRWKRAEMPREAGQPPVVYAVGVDVTEELELERRARQAERLAAVGTLAAGLAHEVRNPLNSANLQLQLLERRVQRDKLDASSLSAMLSIIKSEIERLDELVSDFLAFAKPQPLSLEPVDLCRLIQDVVELVSVEASAAQVEITASLSNELDNVPLEPKRIRQVLLNLFRNAIEAMSATGGTLTVRAYPAPDTATAIVEVEDTGPGFGSDSPVFDAFYTTKDQGTGLGLSIVHRIVTDHGGSIHAKSELGRTRFQLSLPHPSYAPSTHTLHELRPPPKAGA